MEDIYEIVKDIDGIEHRGQKGGLSKLWQKLLEIESKIDELNSKIPEAQKG